MKNNPNQEILAKFKVEELKQRIEFDLAEESLDSANDAAWKEKSISASATKDGPKVEAKLTW